MSAPAPAPTDPEGRLVSLATGPVHVVEEGPADAPAVVLLHGIPGSVRDWRYLAPALVARGLRAVRVDLPGFGKTPTPTFPDPVPQNRAAFLVQLLDALGEKDAVLGAHSFGGTLALPTAALFPERVRALVLINSAGTVRHKGLGFLPPRVLRTLAKGFFVPGLADVLAEQMRGAYRAMGFREAAHLAAADFAHHARLIGHLDFVTQRWACREVRCPTWVFSARDDALVEPRVSVKLARALGESGHALITHVHLAEGGHHLQKHAAPTIADHLAAALV